MAELDFAWRTRNISRLLFAASAAFTRVKLQALAAAAGGLRLSEPHAALMQNLDRDGARLTRIAARAMLPKQSVGEAVDRAEAVGLVERRPDPQDGRAKIVAFTPEGLRVLDRLRDAVAEAERRMAAVIGRDFLVSIKARLSEYILSADLSAMAAADLTLIPDGEDVWRSANAGRLMALAQRLILADVIDVVREGGADFTTVQLALFRNIDLAGTRLTDIAARAGMTKQAMAEIVDNATASGFIDRRPDPNDRRAKTVVFTPEGRRMLDLMGRGVARAERRLATVTDPAFVEDLRAALKAYAESTDRGATVLIDQHGSRLVDA